MKIADVMTRGVELVSPDATVQQAATQMAEHDVGALLVGNGELEGVLTDRDLLLRVLVEGRDGRSLRVREVMSSTIFGCHVDDPIESAFREMSERQVRRLPVFDAHERLVGIVTLSDLSRAEPGHAGESGLVEALREIAEPHRRRTLKSREAQEPEQADEPDAAEASEKRKEPRPSQPSNESSTSSQTYPGR